MLDVVRNRVMRGTAAMAIATVAFCMIGSAQAESFKQALVKAYRGNPTLQAERARQRGTD